MRSGFNGWGSPRPGRPRRRSSPGFREVVKKVAEDDAFVKLLESQGAEARYLTSDEVEKFIKAESDVVGKIYKTLLAEEKSKK